jgi:uncharacterized membrane protein YjfL (UPF0719 family)
MEKQVDFIWHSGVFLVTCLALFLVARLVYKLFNPKINIDQELIEKDNLAFYLGYISYFLAVVLIVGGIMHSGGGDSFWKEVLLTVLYGTVGIILLNVAFLIVDKWIHPSVKMMDEIVVKHNVALGIIKGANYLGTGIIIGGVMLTEVNKPVEVCLFLLLALGIATLGYFYYNIITRFNINTEVYKGNAAVAFSAAGAQIAFAILIYAGFQIEHVSWKESIMSIGIDIFGGFILLPIIRLVVDLVFVSKRKITDELVNQEVPNVGLGIFEGSAYIAGALLFVWCWNL